MSARSCGDSADATAVTIASGSLMRPMPTSPPASSPGSGPTMTHPSDVTVARFRRVAGCSHISVCMAGASTTGTWEARIVATRASDDWPEARRDRVEAVRGATTMASAHRASVVWGDTSSSSNRPTVGCTPVIAANDAAPTNAEADSVMTTLTSAHALVSSRARWTALYAATPPLTPRTMCREASTDHSSMGAMTTLSSTISSRAIDRGLRDREWTWGGT